MILYISPYYLCRYLIPNTPYKIPITPKLPSPKLLSHLWKFPKYHLGTLTFQYPNYLSRRILGWCTKKYMHVILYYCHPLYIKLICLCNFSKYFLYPLRYIFSQNHLPVLWYPYKMILKTIYSMMCSFYWAHTQILYSLLPKGQTCFHPRSRTTGYSTGILIKLRVFVRTGDTTSSARTKMTKNPPHILVTTPESLYLLLTSEGGRKMLSDVHTVIVDEIHALVGNKRGSHLSLSLERLNALTKRGLIRIGLSATQKPIETVARFLIGSNGTNGARELDCTIIDAGHKREVDLAIELPRSPLTAVMSNEVWGEVYKRLEELIKKHKTTLIFVNTRRLAERMTHNLAERLGEEILKEHHCH